MKKSITTIFLLLFTFALSAQTDKIELLKSSDGIKLSVNGKDMMINGMNWDYFPIGTNFTYSLWTQPDSYIKTALDHEMPLLKNMGVNTIRQYTGIPKKWIEYIYNTYGIYTVLNHSFGRYGLNVKGVWKPNTDYSDPDVQDLLMKEVKQMTDEYKNTKGLLMYLLGNENNYGLFWEGAETENIPMEDRKSTIKAHSLYKVFNKAVLAMKTIDTSYPIAICNGDLLFLDLIVKECKDIDVLGLNMYRGMSFGDAFDRVKNEYGKPIMFTEFGSDAFNALTNTEDQQPQAEYMLGNWREIYQNAAGMGKAGNSLGGFTFQFSDGWWKYGQTTNLDIHDAHASWNNGGYLYDYKSGENNMNEEWFGICAKGSTDENGYYQLYPRTAYYVLKQVHQFSPFQNGATAQSLQNYFGNIHVMDAALLASGNKAELESTSNKKLKLSNMRLEMTTFNTGGSLISTPDQADPNKSVYPNQLGFDHMQSFYFGLEANPSNTVRAEVQFNVLGHVAQNPIDEIFYENRGRPVEVITTNGRQELQDIDRVQVYRGSISWDDKLFTLNAFYRTGHYHWGYEGDFFGLYPEANYGPNIDLYNGEAPLGFELTGKRIFDGFKLAFGPQLWWGANPAALIKYSKKVGKFSITGIFHEDLAQRSGIESSFAIPQPQTRRATLHIARAFGKLSIETGGIWAGQPLNGRIFQAVRGSEGNYTVYQDEIKSSDNWGGKLKVTYLGDRLKWYAQGAAMGLVANGGADYTSTITGWRLKDCGSGNQYNVLGGFAYSTGYLQIAPNFLWQKPIEGPIPVDVPEPGRPRNILEDPFSVRVNRETMAGELLLTFDPTPATYIYNWDNDAAEDADFAISADLVYRHLPTTQDAAIGIFPDGRSSFAFPGAAPAKDLWELNARVLSKSANRFGFIANVYAGDAQANGSDKRTISRYGAELRAIYKKTKLISYVRLNDWGPYDYHRDFNLTYPLQLMADISTEVGKPDWVNMPGTRIGLRGTYRTLDRYSPRYQPTLKLDASGNLVRDPDAIGFPNGNEWEIRTYILINIGK